MKRDLLQMQWTLGGPNPDMGFVLGKHHHWAVIPNYDHHPNPWYVNQQPKTTKNNAPLIPFSRPINQDRRTILVEDEAKPLADSPPVSPRRQAAPLVAYPPPQGPAAPAPIIFNGQVKQEPREDDQYVQPRAISRVPIPPGNPGAAFRTALGTKMTTRQGFRRRLPYKMAVKSSHQYKME